MSIEPLNIFAHTAPSAPNELVIPLSGCTTCALTIHVYMSGSHLEEMDTVEVGGSMCTASELGNAIADVCSQAIAEQVSELNTSSVAPQAPLPAGVIVGAKPTGRNAEPTKKTAIARRTIQKETRKKESKVVSAVRAIRDHIYESVKGSTACATAFNAILVATSYGLMFARGSLMFQALFYGATTLTKACGRKLKLICEMIVYVKRESIIKHIAPYLGGGTYKTIDEAIKSLPVGPGRALSISKMLNRIPRSVTDAALFEVCNTLPTAIRNKLRGV